MDDSTQQATVSELVTPDMANFHGTLHGGKLLSLADKAAYVCASRYSGKYCVTAAFDRVDFIEPVHVGDLLIFLAEVIAVGNTSLTVEITVTAEDTEAGSVRKCAVCFVTMVAMKDGEPTPVPDLDCETTEDYRDCLRARRRKELAEEYQAKIQSEEQRIKELNREEIIQELNDQR